MCVRKTNRFSFNEKMKRIMFNLIFKFILWLCLSTYLVSAATKGKNVTTTTTTTTTAKPLDFSGSETRHYETSLQIIHPGESVSRSISYSQSSQDYQQHNPDYGKGRYEEQSIGYEKEQSPNQEYYKGNEGNYGQQEQQSPNQEYYKGNEGNYGQPEKQSPNQEYYKGNEGHYGQPEEQSPNQEYYKGNEGNYGQPEPQQQLRYSQPNDYSNSNSYESPYQQQSYHGNEEHGYSNEEVPQQGNAYPPAYSGKDQSSYEQQDYSKKNSYESTKEAAGYSGGRPPFHYAYEVAGQQQDSYSNQDASSNAGNSGYGSGETESYSPKIPQEPEYYPKPNAIRYIPVPQDLHKVQYRPEEQQQKGNYFPDVPKDAGYVPEGQKEPGYLQSPQNEPKQAGYSPRNPEPSAFLPMLPKGGAAGVSEDGKVAVYIKHLGHKTPGTHQYVHKERQGFLLLPVVHNKMEEKLKELKEQFKQELEQNYDGAKQSNYKQGPVLQEQVYVQPKIVQYQQNTKVQHGPSYSLDEASLKPEIKTIISHGPSYNLDHVSVKQDIKSIASHGPIASYGQQPVIKQAVYTESQYEAPKAHVVSAGYTSDASPVSYHPQIVTKYEEVPKAKVYSPGVPLVYTASPKVISSLPADVKYEPATVYQSAPKYISPYDVTTAPKTVSIKVKEVQRPTYASLYHASGYPRIVDYTSIAEKAKKRFHSVSPLYSTRHSSSPRLATAYEHPSLNARKSVALFLQKSKEPEVAHFRPSTYSSRGRISAKALVQDFGLHDYESLLSKPSHSSAVDPSLYYDLHAFPAHHVITRYGYRRSGLVPLKSTA